MNDDDALFTARMRQAMAAIQQEDDQAKQARIAAENEAFNRRHRENHGYSLLLGIFLFVTAVIASDFKWTGTAVVSGVAAFVILMGWVCSWAVVLGIQF